MTLSLIGAGETSGTVANDATGNGRNGVYSSLVSLGVPGALADNSDTAGGLPRRELR